jgi:thioredoxin reductase
MDWGLAFTIGAAAVGATAAIYSKLGRLESVFAAHRAENDTEHKAMKKDIVDITKVVRAKKGR